MPKKNKMSAFLGLGSNQGDRLLYIQKAIEQLAYRGSILQVSSIYETTAWGNTLQANFLNCVLEIETTLCAESLLLEIFDIEASLGRQRKGKWQPRTIDIDILYFGSQVVKNDLLKIPHPFLPQRRFVLVPLNEVAPDFLHPVLQKTNRVLLRECPDKLDVWLFEWQKLKRI